MTINNIGVVGCGQMGSGIARVCARSGYRVLVSEASDGLLQQGLDGIRRSLDEEVAKGRLSQQEKADIINRIQGTTDIRGFAVADLVIEAALENLALKKKIMAELDAVCPAPAILATNTSCLSVTGIAQATRRQDRVLGIHFFNPVPSMKLVEIVRAAGTSDETVEIARRFAVSLGKRAVITPDNPGFIVNRLLVPFLLNAIRLAESNAVTKEYIDAAVTLGLNHPLGPLALADLIGLDTVLSMADGIYQALGDPQYLAPDLLRKMVAAGRMGRKTGKGFYEYK